MMFTSASASLEAIAASITITINTKTKTKQMSSSCECDGRMAAADPDGNENVNTFNLNRKGTVTFDFEDRRDGGDQGIEEGNVDVARMNDPSWTWNGVVRPDNSYESKDVEDNKAAEVAPSPTKAKAAIMWTAPTEEGTSASGSGNILKVATSKSKRKSKNHAKSTCTYYNYRNRSAAGRLMAIVLAFLACFVSVFGDGSSSDSADECRKSLGKEYQNCPICEKVSGRQFEGDVTSLNGKDEDKDYDFREIKIKVCEGDTCKDCGVQAKATGKDGTTKTINLGSFANFVRRSATSATAIFKDGDSTFCPQNKKSSSVTVWFSCQAGQDCDSEGEDEAYDYDITAFTEPNPCAYNITVSLTDGTGSTPTPSRHPSEMPTTTRDASLAPSTSKHPSDLPSSKPSFEPSDTPSKSAYPSSDSSSSPSKSSKPSSEPSDTPSKSAGPSSDSSSSPSKSSKPSSEPSDTPSKSAYPSSDSSSSPSKSSRPSSEPSLTPSKSAGPSSDPSSSPSKSSRPSFEPSDTPSKSAGPSSDSSSSPSKSSKPSSEPSDTPSKSADPSSDPSSSPSKTTTTTNAPSSSSAPSTSNHPSLSPSQPPTPNYAVFDSALGVPKCSAGSSCHSGDLLLGRYKDGPDGGPEPNWPNSLNPPSDGDCMYTRHGCGADGCYDGVRCESIDYDPEYYDYCKTWPGGYHVDLSIDQIIVTRTSGGGGDLTAGDSVTITAIAWCFQLQQKDYTYIDFYYASDALNPEWKKIGERQYCPGGPQTLTATYELPRGDLQAVRVNIFSWAHLEEDAINGCLNGYDSDVDDMVLTVATPTYAPSTSPSTHPSSSPTGVCANPICADCPASVCDGCAICGEVFGEQYVHGVDLFNYRIKVCDGQSPCQDCDCGVYQQDRNTDDIYFLGSFTRFENVIGKEKTIKAIFEGGRSDGCPDNRSRSSIVTFDKECCEVCDEYVVRVSEEVPCVYQITLIFFDVDDGTNVCASPICKDCPASVYVYDGCAICGEVFGEQFVREVDSFNYRIKVCDGQSPCQDCGCGVYQEDRNTEDIYSLGSFIRFENVIGKEKTIKAIFEGGRSDGCPDNRNRSSIVTFDKESCVVCDEYDVEVSEEVPCVYQITLTYTDGIGSLELHRRRSPS